MTNFSVPIMWNEYFIAILVFSIYHDNQEPLLKTMKRSYFLFIWFFVSKVCFH